MPRSVLDLQLSKSLSKSDSNLVAVSPIQVSVSALWSGITEAIVVSLCWSDFGKYRNLSNQLNNLPNWAKMVPSCAAFSK